jgi:hypothetical protein
MELYKLQTVGYGAVIAKFSGDVPPPPIWRKIRGLPGIRECYHFGDDDGGFRYEIEFEDDMNTLNMIKPIAAIFDTYFDGKSVQHEHTTLEGLASCVKNLERKVADLEDKLHRPRKKQKRKKD